MLGAVDSFGFCMDIGFLTRLTLSVVLPLLPWSAHIPRMFLFFILYPLHLDTIVVIAAFLTSALTLGGCVVEAYWVPSAILGCVSTTILAVTCLYAPHVHSFTTFRTFTNFDHIHTTPCCVYPVSFTHSYRCCTAL